MKRQILVIAILLLTIKPGSAQQVYIDSLKNEVLSSTNDTLKLLLVERIANTYAEINPDSAYYYAEWMSVISKKLNLKSEEAIGLGESGYALLNLGNYPWSLQSLPAAVSIAGDPKSEKNILSAVGEIKVETPPTRTGREGRAGSNSIAFMRSLKTCI